jgi:hypothetical protein
MEGFFSLFFLPPPLAPPSAVMQLTKNEALSLKSSIVLKNKRAELAAIIKQVHRRTTINFALAEFFRIRYNWKGA